MGEPTNLVFWREKIDALDTQIIDLINQRAALAIQIGTWKKEQHLPVLDPAREKQVLERVTGKNSGPVAKADVEKIFSAVMDSCRNLENIQQ
jgi:chorismate mutase/prephenate dehydratase